MYKVPVSSETYTTEQAAAAVGISRQTLQAWIANGKIKAPRRRIRGSQVVRLWAEPDVAQLRRVKERIYLKGLGRPRKKK